MSAAPYITVRERSREARTVQRPTTKRHLKQTETVQVSAKRKSKYGLSGMEFAATQAVTFVLLAAATFMFSVLIGNSMSEYERRKAVDAGVKVKIAEADIVRLRQRFDRLNSSTEVGDWAIARGFIPAYGDGAVEGNGNTN